MWSVERRCRASLLVLASIAAVLYAAPRVLAQSPDVAERRATAEALGPAHGTSTIVAELPFFGWFLAENGELESACLSGKLAEDIASFPGDNLISRDLMAKMQKSAIRISFPPADEIEKAAKSKLNIRNFRLGNTFSAYSTNKIGICSGTLIAPDLVLTAGHCVSPKYWKATMKAAIPAELTSSGQHKRDLGANELSRLLQIDVNYQLQYLASQDPSLPELGVQPIHVPVAGLVKGYYDPQSTTDYAVLRLERTETDLAPFALGMHRLEFARPRTRIQLAIIQHPSGGFKKIATGTLSAMENWRLHYANIHTAGGSSGAGIYNASGDLIGLHARGGCNVRNGTNKGMHIGAIRGLLSGLGGTR